MVRRLNPQRVDLDQLTYSLTFHEGRAQRRILGPLNYDIPLGGLETGELMGVVSIYLAM